MSLFKCNNCVETFCPWFSSDLKLLVRFEYISYQVQCDTYFPLCSALVYMILSSLCICQAERSRVVEQLQEQDLLLEAARCNIQTELEVALTLKVNLQLELWVSFD